MQTIYTLQGELLPSNARSMGSAVTMGIDSVVIFLVSKLVPAMNHAIGIGWVFVIFSGFCSAMALFCYLFVPETYGKSLEQIEAHYRKICYGDAQDDNGQSRTN